MSTPKTYRPAVTRLLDDPDGQVIPLSWSLDAMRAHQPTPERELQRENRDLRAQLDTTEAERDALAADLKQLLAEHEWALDQIAAGAKAQTRGEVPDCQLLAARAIGRHSGYAIHAHRPTGRHRKAA